MIDDIRILDGMYIGSNSNANSLMTIRYQISILCVSAAPGVQNPKNKVTTRSHRISSKAMMSWL